MNNWSSIRSEHDIFSDTGRGPHTQVRHHVWSGLKGVRLWRDTTAAEQTAGAPARTPYNDCLHYCLPGVPDIYLQRPARAGTAEAGCPCVSPDAPARAGGLHPQHRVLARRRHGRRCSRYTLGTAMDAMMQRAQLLYTVRPYGWQLRHAGGNAVSRSREAHATTVVGGLAHLQLVARRYSRDPNDDYVLG